MKQAESHLFPFVTNDAEIWRCLLYAATLTLLHSEAKIAYNFAFRSAVGLTEY